MIFSLSLGRLHFNKIIHYVCIILMRGEGLGLREKKVPKKKPTWTEREKKKGRLEFATLLSPGTGRDEKGTPISASSIHTFKTMKIWWFPCFLLLEVYS
jgi:hypothetical protein